MFIRDNSSGVKEKQVENYPKVDMQLMRVSQPKRRNFKDHLILGPIQKYVRYGLFPWKFLVHITLLFLTAAQVLLLIKPESGY